MSPEYSYPGVYIEELPSSVHPIPGVSQPVPFKRLFSARKLTALRTVLARAAGGCPGATLLLTGPNKKARLSAVRALARKLQLNVYRVDLAAIVNKYIGETEKNLDRIFDSAEDGRAILFFDEADALFGKRSEVKDSHNRYANVDTSYLLQRLNGFHSLAILATSHKRSIDSAFLRKLRQPVRP